MHQIWLDTLERAREYLPIESLTFFVTEVNWIVIRQIPDI